MSTSDPLPAPAGRGTRRTVLLTLAAVGLAALLVGGGTAAYVAYDRQVDEAGDAQAQVAALQAERDELVRSVATLQREVEKESKRATAEYLRGLEVGREREQNLSSEIGLDYNGGYNDAFEGFGAWQTDAFYFVKVVKGDGDLKYEMVSRGLFEPCTAYFVKGDSIWTRSESC